MKKNRTKIVAMLLCAAIIICLAAFAGCAEKKPAYSGTVVPGEIRKTESYSEVYDIISEMSKGGYDYGIMVDDALVMEDAAGSDFFAESEKEESITTNGAMTPEYSGTNVQVEGVDEGDIIKTDGKYIYILRYGNITIADSESLTELCTVPIEGKDYSSANQMYIYGDKLAVVVNVDNWYKYYIINGEYSDEYNYSQETAVIIYDISDRKAPKVEKTFSQSGNILSTRMIGSKIYTVTTEHVWENEIEKKSPETFIPVTGIDGKNTLIACEDICIFPEVDSAVFNIITSVDVESAQQYDSVKAALGGYGTVYADTDSLILAISQNKYEETEGTDEGKNYIKTESRYETSILLYDLTDGKITEKASGIIPGSLLNQFSIDEYNGYYRFVTTDSCWSQTVYTDGLDKYEYDSSESNGLYVLDSDLKSVSSIDNLAEDENVKSVRFDGDVVYFVTFRQTDPLFTVDLSNPESPKIMSELKIPGFSSYLHKFGEGRLLGLGFDADEDTGWTKGLKLSMFDTSDPHNVTEKHKLILEEGWSEATYNHKAILVSVEKNLIAFPAEDGYFVYGYNDESGFYLRNEVEISDYYYYAGVSRGLFIGDRFYVCSNSAIEAFDMDSFETCGRLKLSDLEQK